MKKDDREVRLRVAVALGIFIYLLIAWSCIISFLIKIIDIVGIINAQEKIYFLIGFICGLLCSLMAIHKQDIEDFIKGNIK